MLLHRRIYQFFIIYLMAVAFLFLIKYGLNLSDYVIPGPVDVWHTGIREFSRYFSDVMNTMMVAVVGQTYSPISSTVSGGAAPMSMASFTPSSMASQEQAQMELVGPVSDIPTQSSGGISPALMVLGGVAVLGIGGTAIFVLAKPKKKRRRKKRPTKVPAAA